MTTISEFKDQEHFINEGFNKFPFVLLNFYETWHEPCLTLNNKLLTLNNNFSNIKFFNVEVSQNIEFTESFNNIESVPTLILLSSNTKQIISIHEGDDIEAITLMLKKNAIITDNKSTKSTKTTKITEKESLNERLSKLINVSPVVLFMKGTPDEPKCGFSRTMISLLSQQHLNTYTYFNILDDNTVRQGLKEFSNWPTYPQIYCNGELIGGLDTIKELIEEDEFKETFSTSITSENEEESESSNTAAQSTKIAFLNQRIKELIESHPIMLFMKGTPDSPQCGFSRKAIALLKEENIDLTNKSKKFGSFDILTDQDIRAQIKIYSDWPTFPQLYINGQLIGGISIMEEMKEDEELSDALNF